MEPRAAYRCAFRSPSGAVVARGAVGAVRRGYGVGEASAEAVGTFQAAGAEGEAMALAAGSGDVAKLRRAVAAAAASGAGVDASSVLTDGATALVRAVFSPRAPVAVRVLLDAGADPNAANALGCTPLLGASQRGRADVVAALLAAGAARDDADVTGQTALGLAVARAGADLPPALDCLAALLHAGADPNAARVGARSDGTTPDAPLDAAAAGLAAFARAGRPIQAHERAIAALAAAGAAPARGSLAHVAPWSPDAVAALLAAGADASVQETPGGGFDFGGPYLGQFGA